MNGIDASLLPTDGVSWLGGWYLFMKFVDSINSILYYTYKSGVFCTSFVCASAVRDVKKGTDIHIYNTARISEGDNTRVFQDCETYMIRLSVSITLLRKILKTLNW